VGREALGRGKGGRETEGRDGGVAVGAHVKSVARVTQHGVPR